MFLLCWGSGRSTYHPNREHLAEQNKQMQGWVDLYKIDNSLLKQNDLRRGVQLMSQGKQRRNNGLQRT